MLGDDLDGTRVLLHKFTDFLYSLCTVKCAIDFTFVAVFLVLGVVFVRVYERACVSPRMRVLMCFLHMGLCSRAVFLKAASNKNNSKLKKKIFPIGFVVQIKLITEVQGNPPHHMLSAGEKTLEFFNVPIPPSADWCLKTPAEHKSYSRGILKDYYYFYNDFNAIIQVSSESEFHNFLLAAPSQLFLKFLLKYISRSS